MTKIRSVKALEILDSRGQPTIYLRLTTTGGHIGEARIPSGASTGSKEALELRDKDPHRYLGKGVTKAVRYAEGPLFRAVEGMSVFDQAAVDAQLIAADGTPNKERYGANAILALSLANADAAARARGTELYDYLGKGSGTLPLPMFNIMNGGEHANNTLDFQEFMIRPVGIESFADKIRTGSEIFHTLKRILAEKGYSTAVGDEGGFAPSLKNAEEALTLIVEACEKAGYKPGHDVTLALDCAANFYFQKGGYAEGVKTPHPTMRSTEEYISYLEALTRRFPIDSIEDPMAENDHDGWKAVTRRLGKKIQLVGDDIFVTNKALFAEGIRDGIANAILIKPNQIGTLSETLDTIDLARRSQYKTVISHRSGETEDTFIADLAVATNAGQIKTGSLSRSERVAKYNRLLYIADILRNR